VRILLTGGTGFVGRAMISTLASAGHGVIVPSRTAADLTPASTCLFPGLELQFDLQPLLVGIDTVIHCAARVHVMVEHEADPLEEFRRTNVEGTLRLACQAASAGVRRFIFISSIKVNGESSLPGKPFLPSDLPAPQDAYGLSKLEAEQGLLALAQESGMKVVIIRPPLIYGPGVKGNFASMIKLVDKGLPLPLGAIHNQRSLVGIDNLVDLIIRCIDHPAAANRVFLAGDGEDISTTELLRALGRAMGRPARLIPVPAALLSCGAALLGKQEMAQRLLGSLQVDISETCKVLDWRPPFTVEQGLRKCFE
jgi:nucleoside-diphosphate-sugar epimerase